MTAQLKIENGTPLITPADRAGRLVLTAEMVEEIIAGFDENAKAELSA